MSSTRNKQDANASTFTAQQVQGPIPTLPTALPQDEQNAVVLQVGSKSPRSKPINSLLISIALILMVIGVLVWVLNITETIQGPWASVCAALFSSAGTFITALQLYFQFTTSSRSDVNITIYSGKVTTIDRR